MIALNEYEAEQLDAIREWKEKDVNIVLKIVESIGAPITLITRFLIPESVISGAINGANKAGGVLADSEDIKLLGGVSDVRRLRFVDLELSDFLADGVTKWAVGMAAAEGAITGVGGMFSLAIDIPIIVTLALRTIHKIGLCYGYEAKSEADNQFALGVLSAACSNSMVEKVGALSTLGVTIQRV